jgi:hypothetical protein
VCVFHVKQVNKPVKSLVIKMEEKTMVTRVIWM